jgi:hypothetical protein
MADYVKSVLGKWVQTYHWDEVVIGTEWRREPRALRSLWRNGYMANQKGRDISIRLVRDVEEK